MALFKLKSGVTFTPQGARYIVLDRETQSTFRIGEIEYQILKSFEEATDVEEVGYALGAQRGLKLSYEALQGFITKAIELDLLHFQGQSFWQRLSPGQAFSYRIKLFDPNRAIDAVMRKGKPLFNRYGLLVTLALIIAATAITLTHLSEMWIFHSFSIPPYFFLVFLVIFLGSIGHEMMHGLAGKWFGFDVREVGLHLHYFLPSFYCRIFRPAEFNRRAILTVLIAGSFFDMVVASLLVLLWWVMFDANVVRDLIAVMIWSILMKICLIQLNPLWPHSDGYSIVGLLIFQKRESDVK